MCGFQGLLLGTTSSLVKHYVNKYIVSIVIKCVYTYTKLKTIH